MRYEGLSVVASRDRRGATNPIVSTTIIISARLTGLRRVSRGIVGTPSRDTIIHFHRCVTQEGQITVMSSSRDAPLKHGPMIRNTYNRFSRLPRVLSYPTALSRPLPVRWMRASLGDLGAERTARGSRNFDVRDNSMASSILETPLAIVPVCRSSSLRGLSYI